MGADDYGDISYRSQPNSPRVGIGRTTRLGAPGQGMKGEINVGPRPGNGCLIDFPVPYEANWEQSYSHEHSLLVFFFCSLRF
ncbi:hypothetical protein RRG08_030864 [Elysia crispata]|uniref:Uncharacterized protein n=1 Tax=Elysia crispata TaxID=231223 RepID=A0AAE0XT07_9GAST|nr:hypothetical protein RRG08_030864 [Elysia crispata]